MNTLIRLKRVIERTGLSRSTIYLLMSRGEFIRPVKVSDRCIAWPEAEVNEWIEAKIAERETV